MNSFSMAKSSPTLGVTSTGNPMAQYSPILMAEQNS
ncbi:hypothetical protein SAMN04515668_2388 [Hymenobacter arizonensis]|uniref:Uncharacterized protein n=1 Tax=Hymenobacter arizonensis TaxID=1227077 RepID=A0A1I5YRF7_HYMAR|nr:hypothetical protein SAMN04515668_2388 [Hymenobacter arizonensis]